MGNIYLAALSRRKFFKLAVGAAALASGAPVAVAGANRFGVTSGNCMTSTGSSVDTLNQDFMRIMAALKSAKYPDGRPWFEEQ